MRRIIPVLLAVLVIMAALPHAAARAQGEGVYVTTQDYASLRAGPGFAFERVAVLPPAMTLPAIGRTADAGWIQVQYGEARGWIRWWLVVWSGDMLSLPLDGVAPAPFARRMLIGWTAGDVPVYDHPLSTPDQVIGHVSGRVELTGRFGSAEAFWVQFWHEGRYYWARSWNLNIVLRPGSLLLNLPDGALMYPYGRLLGRIRLGLDRAEEPFAAVAGLWRDLDAGYPVTCDVELARAPMPTLTDSDLQREPAFVPAAEALLDAIDRTNAAIALFEEACARPDRMLPPDLVAQGMTHIEAAARDYTLVRQIVGPLANHESTLSGQ